MNRKAKLLVCALALLLQSTLASAQQQDPRVGLKAGWRDAGVAASNVALITSLPRPTQFIPADSIGNIMTGNSDFAFQGSSMFLGNFYGFQIYDISDPRAPKLRTAVVCPGGQGDLSVYKHLLFMSVEMPNGRVDCGLNGSFQDSVNAARFRGVRIFDISDLDHPKQVGAVQTCRGSHTHTLVTDPNDSANVYIYVQGAAGVRPASELAGCSGRLPDEDPNSSLFRIEVIRVPVNAPFAATIVNAPRIFADPQTGAIAGLWKGGAQAEGTQQTARTDQCHDITVYPEIGLAAGACSGNGILLDISNPANPKRVTEVFDPNFAYWHSATFNNDASKVLFTDEWGGGMAPRCQATDRPQWGADAIFTLKDRKLTHVGYYKLPAAQSATENCVAHNGSLIPVPGRDIMVQAWYQGGMSIFDWTDPAKPVEIAYFDRGPYSATELMLGGYWSTYWYNGYIYGSEIGRGLDVFELKPSALLTQNEIDAARTATLAVFNPQTQPRYTWPASFVVARAYVDQLKRNKTDAGKANSIAKDLEKAERMSGTARAAALEKLATTAGQLRGNPRVAALLAQTLRELAAQR